MLDPDLIRHVVATTGLPASEAARLVDDIAAYYREPVEDYVRRRHRHLQTYGMKNERIFALLADELSNRLVAAPPLSTRQLRRIIYG